MQALEKLLSIMKALRDPESGCPWDREQSIASIKPYTLEESYEVIDAIEHNDMDGLRAELGDLLFHIVFYAEMANEIGAFNFSDVMNSINEKLIRRHPHVFSDKALDTTEEVKRQWEITKQQERQAAQSGSQLYLDDISAFMPAMLRALKLQKRAAAVGFDWPTTTPIFAKIDEEIEELKASLQQADVNGTEAEMGDLLFCCINLARHLAVDPEMALRRTNTKFIERFHHIEQALKRQGISLNDATLEQMDALWDEAKNIT